MWTLVCRFSQIIELFFPLPSKHLCSHELFHGGKPRNLQGIAHFFSDLSEPHLFIFHLRPGWPGRVRPSQTCWLLRPRLGAGEPVRTTGPLQPHSHLHLIRGFGNREAFLLGGNLGFGVSWSGLLSRPLPGWTLRRSGAQGSLRAF